MEVQLSEGRTCWDGAQGSCDGSLLRSAEAAGPRQARSPPGGPESRPQLRPWVSAEASCSPPGALTCELWVWEGSRWQIGGEMVDLYI